MMAALMAVFCFESTLLYGLAAAQLGAWGPILGWPLFMSLIVIIATTLGIFTGEWKDCGPLPIRIQWTGVTVLVLALLSLQAQPITCTRLQSRELKPSMISPPAARD